METLLAQEEQPDAVFAVSDSLAAGALRAIARAGLRVPEDIAVVGLMAPNWPKWYRRSDHRGTAFARDWPNSGDANNEESIILAAAVERVMMDWRVISRAST